MKHARMRLAAVGTAAVVATIGVVAGQDSAGADTAPATIAWGTSTSAAAGVQGSLNGVAASAAGDVVAVGAHTVAPPDARYLESAYAEHWNGSTWTATAISVPAYFPQQVSVLNDAAAAGPSDSWAVGTAANAAGAGKKTLAYHWNGTSWTRVSTPNPGSASASNTLTDVAARSRSDVWAVGASYDGGPTNRSVLIHWNGTTWSQVSVPDIGELLAVTTDANSVWVAGQKTVLHQTATGWTRLPAPTDADGPSNSLIAPIAAIARSGANLWVGGNRAINTGGGFPDNFYAYAAYWNGTKWTAVDPPSRGAVTDVTASGDGIDATTGSEVFHVSPSGAVQEATPTSVTRARTSNNLLGISRDPAGRDWAVGDVRTGQSGNLAPTIIDGPGLGQGGILVTTNNSSALITWLGPVNGSIPDDDLGPNETGGLPAGSYTVVVSAPYCTPSVQRVTIQAGVASTIDAPVTC